MDRAASSTSFTCFRTSSAAASVAALLQVIEDWARTAADRLWLQVNRGNERAIRAYEKYGFRIIESRVFDIGDGFVMDDHVMEKPL